MTINAQCQITGNTSYLNWDDATTSWEGVIIKIIYPTAQIGEQQQSYASNKPSVGDYIIDESSKVWKILLVDTSWTPKTSNYHFRIKMQVQNRDKIEEVEPEIGNTLKGSICSPVNNALNPISDSSMVSTSVFTASLFFNIKESLISGSPGGTGGETLSDVVTTNTSLEVNKAYPVDTTTGPVTLTVPTGANNDIIKIIDMGKASTNNITITGATFLGTPDASIVIDTDFGIGTLRKINDSYGWSYDNTGY